MEKHILIDYENVHVQSTDLLLGHDIRMTVFLGPANVRLPVSMVLFMQALGERGQYVCMQTSGTNALDFHIAFHLGELVTRKPKDAYCIISKDKGFDPLIKTLQSRGINVSRKTSLEEMLGIEIKAETEVEEDIREVEAEAPSNNCSQRLDGKKEQAAYIEELTNDVVMHLKGFDGLPSSRQSLFNSIKNRLSQKIGNGLHHQHINSVYQQLVNRGHARDIQGRMEYRI